MNEGGAMACAAGEGRPKRRFWHILKRERYAGWSLYFWHGMRARAWFNLMRRNQFRTTLTCLPNVISVSCISVLNSLLYRISEAIYGARADAMEMPPPIFILGHWRTGTTYLHDLLAADPDLGYATTYQCFFPNHFLLTERVARFWLRFFIPETRPQDNVAVGVERPQEDEFGLCNMGLGTTYLTCALAHQGPSDQAYLNLRDLTPEERRTWIEGLLWFLRRVSFRQNKPLVLKSPQHTARIRTLIELFPDARFIHIARDPYLVYPSTWRLWKALNSIQCLENPADDDPWLEPYILDQFMALFRAYEDDRHLIPEGHLAEITYEELVADPKAALRAVYERLDLGDFARAEAGVDAYLDQTRDYQTNAYELPERTRDMVRERWAPYFDRFGYD